MFPLLITASKNVQVLVSRTIAQKTCRSLDYTRPSNKNVQVIPLGVTGKRAGAGSSGQPDGDTGPSPVVGSFLVISVRIAIEREE